MKLGKEYLQQLLDEHCEGLVIKCKDDIINTASDEYRDKFFYNAAHVLCQILEDFGILED